MNPFYEDILNVKHELETDRKDVLTGADRLQSLEDKLCSYGFAPTRTKDGNLKVSFGCRYLFDREERSRRTPRRGADAEKTRRIFAGKDYCDFCGG